MIPQRSGGLIFLLYLVTEEQGDTRGNKKGNNCQTDKSKICIFADLRKTKAKRDTERN